MPEKSLRDVQIGDVVHGDARGSWIRVTSKTTSRGGRVDVTGTDIDTGKPGSTWGMANNTVVTR